MPVDGVLPRKLKVYLIDGKAQMARIFPTAKDRAGLMVTTQADIFAIATRDGLREAGDRPGDADDVVLHEYVHHFHKQYFANAYPRWVVEGYAEYFATADFKPDQVVIGGGNANRIGWLNGTWLPVDQVLDGARPAPGSSDAARFYAQSWLLTHYLLSDAGRTRQFAAYLRSLHEGANPVAAWQAVFGQTPRDLEQALKAYRARPVMGRIVPRGELGTKTVTVTELSPGADAVLLEYQQLLIGAPAATRAEVLERVAKAYARLPNDRWTRLAQGRALTAYGDRAAGEAILQQAIDADPGDWEAMLVMAESRRRTEGVEEAARFAEARRWYLKVLEVDPDCFQALAGSVSMRRILPDYPTDTDIEVIAKAITIAPQAARFRLQMADMLVRRKAKPDEIAAVLAPLLNDPHGEDALVSEARDLMKQAGAPS
jgi:tetratricopeptide (TPR) repeat protein